MKAKRSTLRNLRAKVCEVTLGEGERSVTFDAVYDANIPASLYLSLMEMSQIGEDLQKVNEQIGDMAGLSDEQKVSRAGKARGALSDIRDRLVEFAELLAKVFISQEYYDDDDKPIPPDFAYFSTCSLEDQVAYAKAIVSEKQRPTNGSESSLPATSSQMVSTEAAQLTSSLIEPQSITAAPDGNSSHSQTPLN